MEWDLCFSIFYPLCSWATSHLPEFLSFSLEMYIVHQSSYDHLLHAIKARATLIKGNGKLGVSRGWWRMGRTALWICVECSGEFSRSWGALWWEIIGYGMLKCLISTWLTLMNWINVFSDDGVVLFSCWIWKNFDGPRPLLLLLWKFKQTFKSLCLSFEKFSKC